MSKEAYANAVGAAHMPKQGKPVLAEIRVKEAENDGHIVEHHFESKGPSYHEPKEFAFAEHDGEKPQIPEGHVLAHIAKHMNIPHEVLGRKGTNEEPEEE